MTIAIRLGASSTAYNDLNGAYVAAAAAKQKLSITGTGEEIKNELSTLFGNGSQSAIDNFNLVSKTIGSIKATNDLNLSTSEVSNYKAALVKLGSKSIVLASSITSPQLADKFNELDAVYTKVKSITLSDANDTTPTIAVSKLPTAVNMGGLEILTGKKFNVSGTATDIKTNMDAVLKNISRIDKVIVNSGNVQFTAKELSIVGDKLVKSGNATVVLKDTADNLLSTSSIAMMNKLNNTNINTAAVTATVTEAGVAAASLLAAAGAAAAAPEPPLKSVAYQPEPLSWNPAAVSCLVKEGLPHCGQSLKGASEIFCKTSLAWPQDPHL
jgi:hypothetical protein